MGRHPNSGGPVFRFTHNEVIEMEACLQGLKNAIPAREMICALAEKFSASTDRAGKTVVQSKQVWNWFQNRRYSQRAKVKAPGNLNAPPVTVDESAQFRNVDRPVPFPQGQSFVENIHLEFEAKSARDGAWVRFSGFGVEEDEWINVRKEQALYFDAHILDAQRRRHDVRGCRCRFLVRYDHDQSEEIVPLRKVCRRPETDFRLRQLQALRASGSAGSSRDQNLIPQRIRKQSKLMEVNTAEMTTIALPALARIKDSSTTQIEVDHKNVSVLMTSNFGKAHEAMDAGVEV